MPTVIVVQMGLGDAIERKSVSSGSVTRIVAAGVQLAKSLPTS